MESYEEMLKRAEEKLPEIVTNTKRFEVPKVKGHIEGNKTIITNYFVIVNKIRRRPEHLLKYLQRELATPAILDGQRLILKRRLKAAQINEKINAYVNEYVLCSECKKPDTKLVYEDKHLVKKCMACGAKKVVKSL